MNKTIKLDDYLLTAHFCALLNHDWAKESVDWDSLEKENIKPDASFTGNALLSPMSVFRDILHRIESYEESAGRETWSRYGWELHMNSVQYKSGDGRIKVRLDELGLEITFISFSKGDTTWKSWDRDVFQLYEPGNYAEVAIEAIATDISQNGQKSPFWARVERMQHIRFFSKSLDEAVAEAYKMKEETIVQ